MKHLIFLILFFSAIAIDLTSHSVLASTINENLEEEIQTFFVNYVGHYNAYLHGGDELYIERAVEHYFDPALVLGSTPLVLKNTDVKTNITRALKSFKNKGVNLMKWSQIDVCLLSESTAIASNVISRFKQNGTLQTELGATFMLAKGPSDWQIAAISLHEPEHARSLINCAYSGS